MTINRITINGQRYASPEAMPPDVRRLYDEAMRTAGSSLASGQSGGSTQVFTGQTGSIGGSVVVNRTITVNNRTFGSIDELPPDVRQLYENALKAAAPQAGTTHPRTSLHVSVNMGRPQAFPMEPSYTESRIRSIPMSLAWIVVIGLILWAFLR